MCKTQVEGLIMWGFWDSAHWRPQAAIAEGDVVTPNQAGEAYIRLMHEVMLQLLWTMFKKHGHSL